MNERITWVDTAKGVGIVLVVFGHVWRGVQGAGLMPDDALFQAVDRAIYAFHMPFFFVLSGLFFAPAIVRNDAVPFFSQRLRRLIWPLFLWTWIFFLFKAAAGSVSNTPENWSDFPFIPLPPQAHFWFLWALFLIQITLYLTRPLLAGQPYRLWVWFGALVVAIAIALTLPGIQYLGGWAFGAFVHAPFLILGILMVRFPPKCDGALTFAVHLCVFAAAIYVAVTLPQGRALDLAIAAVASYALCGLCVGLVARYPIGRLINALASLGVASMAIYVSHTIFAAAWRVALLTVGQNGLANHVISGTVAGLALPYIMWIIARRLRIAGLLGF